MLVVYFSGENMVQLLCHNGYEEGKTKTSTYGHNQRVRISIETNRPAEGRFTDLAN